VSLGQYLLGVLELGVVVGAIGLGVWRLRGRLVPGWAGGPARLAEAVLALCLLVWVGELLGAIGLLKPAPFIAGCLLAGAAAAAVGRRGNPAAPSTPGGLDAAIAVGVSTLVFAAWAVPSRFGLEHGMYGGDTLWYHMPFAARFVQDSSVVHLHFTDPLYLNWFYPQSSELLHGVGILLFRHHDVLSPLLNLAFLGLALLAAWCAGRPFGVGAHSLVAVAIVLDANLLVSRQAGQANNDIVGIALLLAAAAFVLTRDPGSRGPPLLAGLAAGLAAATKLSFIVPGVALAAGAVAIAAAGERRRIALLVGGGFVAAGGFWYARNLIAVGNPLPWIDPGPLPSPDRLIEGRPDFSVAHYLTDTDVWGTYFRPALEERLGELWWAVLALAAVGALMALLTAHERSQRLLGAVAVIAALAYVLTPLGASGPEGQPVGFRLNLRYLTPALVLGLALLPILPALEERRRRWGLLALLGVLLIVTDRPFAFLDDELALGAVIVALVLVTAPALLVGLRRRGLPGPILALGFVTLIAVAISVGYQEQRDYLRGRYASSFPAGYPAPILKRGLGDTFRWAGSVRRARIAVAGTTGALFQYGFYGNDASNRVQYVGGAGPHGAFSPILDCRDWRRAINAGEYNYIVTTPILNQRRESEEIPAPEASWLSGDRAAMKILRRGRYRVFQIEGPLDPEGCPADAPRFPVDAFFPGS
jgi:hypothetical protein